MEHNTFMTTKGWFIDMNGERIEYDAIVRLQRMPASLPNDPDGYIVTYLPKGSSEPEIKRVSYFMYCALKPDESAYAATLNAETDAHG